MVFMRALQYPPQPGTQSEKSGKEKKWVTGVTGVTPAPLLDSGGNFPEISRVTGVTSEVHKVYSQNDEVTQGISERLPEKINDSNVVARLTLVTPKGKDSKFITGLEGIPSTPPEDDDYTAWEGAVDLRAIAMQYGIKIYRSVRGSILGVYPPPINLQLIEYSETCLRDCMQYLFREFLAVIPELPPHEALAAFRELGGDVRPVGGDGIIPWYPPSWPGYARGAAERLFLAGMDAIEDEIRREIENAAKQFNRSAH